MVDSEIWKDIPDLPGYQVSDLGRVRSVDRFITDKNGVRKRVSGRVKSAPPNEDGYPRTSVSVNGVNRKYRVHALVALAFLGPQPDGMEVCHNNGDPADNRPSNLRYDTHQNNILDAVKHGTWHETKKTHCPSGHEYSGENLRVSARGQRICRECERTRAREWFRNNKSKGKHLWKKPHL